MAERERRMDVNNSSETQWPQHHSDPTMALHRNALSSSGPEEVDTSIDQNSSGNELSSSPGEEELHVARAIANLSSTSSLGENGGNNADESSSENDLHATAHREDGHGKALSSVSGNESDGRSRDGVIDSGNNADESSDGHVDSHGNDAAKAMVNDDSDQALSSSVSGNESDGRSRDGAIDSGNNADESSDGHVDSHGNDAAKAMVNDNSDQALSSSVSGNESDGRSGDRRNHADESSSSNSNGKAVVQCSSNGHSDNALSSASGDEYNVDSSDAAIESGKHADARALASGNSDNVLSSASGNEYGVDSGDAAIESGNHDDENSSGNGSYKNETSKAQGISNSDLGLSSSSGNEYDASSGCAVELESMSKTSGGGGGSNQTLGNRNSDNMLSSTSGNESGDAVMQGGKFVDGRNSGDDSAVAEFGRNDNNDHEVSSPSGSDRDAGSGGAAIDSGNNADESSSGNGSEPGAKETKGSSTDANNESSSPSGSDCDAVSCDAAIDSGNNADESSSGKGSDPGATETKGSSSDPDNEISFPSGTDCDTGSGDAAMNIGNCADESSGGRGSAAAATEAKGSSVDLDNEVSSPSGSECGVASGDAVVDSGNRADELSRGEGMAASGSTDAYDSGETAAKVDQNNEVTKGDIFDSNISILSVAGMSLGFDDDDGDHEPTVANSKASKLPKRSAEVAFLDMADVLGGPVEGAHRIRGNETFQEHHQASKKLKATNTPQARSISISTGRSESSTGHQLQSPLSQQRATSLNAPSGSVGTVERATVRKHTRAQQPTVAGLVLGGLQQHIPTTVTFRHRREISLDQQQDGSVRDSIRYSASDYDGATMLSRQATNLEDGQVATARGGSEAVDLSLWRRSQPREEHQSVQPLQWQSQPLQRTLSPFDFHGPAAISLEHNQQEDPSHLLPDGVQPPLWLLGMQGLPGATSAAGASGGSISTNDPRITSPASSLSSITREQTMNTMITTTPNADRLPIATTTVSEQQVVALALLGQRIQAALGTVDQRRQQQMYEQYRVAIANALRGDATMGPRVPTIQPDMGVVPSTASFPQVSAQNPSATIPTPNMLNLASFPMQLLVAASLQQQQQQQQLDQGIQMQQQPLSLLPAVLPQVLAVSKRGIKLYVPSMDEEVLSESQILLRQQLEFFEADETDVATTVSGRRKPLKLGQVGIRCRHCAHLPLKDRKRAATYYPSKLLRIYQAAQNMNLHHFCDACEHIQPPEIRERLLHNQQEGRGRANAGHGGRDYWAKTASQIHGVVETPTDDGLRMSSVSSADGSRARAATGAATAMKLSEQR